jgi:hypothetical protein
MFLKGMEPTRTECWVLTRQLLPWEIFLLTKAAIARADRNVTRTPHGEHNTMGARSARLAVTMSAPRVPTRPALVTGAPRSTRPARDDDY